MTWLALLILAGATAWLWRRVDALERRLAQFAPDRPAELPATPAPQAEPAIAHPAAVDPGDAALAPEEHPRRSWRFDVEDVFGRLLPIWTGGIALALAGFFLVRWSIDAGLLTPPVRVALAGLFGIVLLAGAEVAYRWRARVADPRVAQALAGAGLATLYAAFYLAGAAYGLIGSTVAFVGLAGVTAAAIGLSGRFGLPSAVLGLVGGFAAPALVGGADANLVMLTIYLALVTGGLALSGRRQDREWIGVAALVVGLAWGGLLLMATPDSAVEVAFVGGYLVLLGAIVPVLFGAANGLQRTLRIAAAAIAALQLAVLVQSGGFGALEWGLYLALGAALAWFGWREPAMREGAALAAAVGVALAVVWPEPAPGALALAGAGLAVLFAGVPLALIARRAAGELEPAQVIGVALGLAGAVYWHFAEFTPDRAQPVTALAILALAGLPALAARLVAPPADRSGPGLREAAQAAAALLAYGALAQIVPADALAWSAALGAVALAWVAPHIRGALWILAAATAAWALAPVTAWLAPGTMALVGRPLAAVDLPALRAIALGLLPAIAAAAAWRVRAPSLAGAKAALDLVIVSLAVIAAHTAFRHGFAAAAGSDFVSTGVIQRAAWEALLVVAAWIAWRRGWRRAGSALTAVAAAHFGWFALGLHNPLWAAQAVGALPLANALVPMFAAGLAALALARRLAPAGPWFARAGVDAAIMAAITLLALAQLRQAFAGSLLTAPPVAPGEDLLRSLLGIVLALGFLLWGARTGARSWRIGSLVVMIAAVLKVFLVDAAGLGGLARIASFMALGFSLIGIGWLYARQLRARAGDDGPLAA